MQLYFEDKFYGNKDFNLYSLKPLDDSYVTYSQNLAK